jgi:hypothetical protein
MSVADHPHLAAEDGVSLIEVMVAALLVVLVVGASLMAIDVSSGSSLDSQRGTQSSAVAQRELELVRQVPFDELGLVALPTPAAGTGVAPGGVSPDNPADPDVYVRPGATFRVVESHSDRTSPPLPRTPVEGEPLVGGGTVVARETVQSGAATFDVRRYVTERAAFCMTPGACDGDSKRITVAVAVVDPLRPLNSVNPQRPVWFSTVINRAVPSAQVADGAPLSLDLDVTIP